jgi:type VI secretion system protein ImpL
MKRLLSWLFKRSVLSFIGVALLALVFWFEAPLLAFDGKEPFASRTPPGPAGSAGACWRRT